VFQLHGVDGIGRPVHGKRLRRHEVLSFFARLRPAFVGMEACGRRGEICRSAGCPFAASCACAVRAVTAPQTIEKSIRRWHLSSEPSRRLVPGIGPITATALIATIAMRTRFAAVVSLRHG
jgi:transposase